MASFKISRYLFLLAALCFSLVACEAPRLDPLSSRATILAFGDSLTFGTGASSGNSYPTILESLTGLTVVNSGVPGEVSAQGLDRLPLVFERTRPDLLILIHGGNDILRNLSNKTLRQNLSAMIEYSIGEGVPVVLIGVPEKNLFTRSAPLYGEVAAQYDLVFDGVLLGNLMRRPGLKSDPVHLNDDGYRAMAESIYELLEDNGAL